MKVGNGDFRKGIFMKGLIFLFNTARVSFGNNFFYRVNIGIVVNELQRSKDKLI